MKFYSVITLTTTLFSLAYSMAIAQEEGGKAETIEFKDEKKKRLGREKPKKGKRAIHRSFDKLDEDKDGFLSFMEFVTSVRLANLDTEKRRSLFNFLDRNKDGKVERSELGPRHQEKIAILRNNFKSLDIDQNSQLSFEEFIENELVRDKGLDEQRILFKHLDDNQDGFIVLDELKKGSRHKMRMAFDFKKNDEDKNGTLDYSEYATLPFVSKFDDLRKKKHFERIDTDEDGEISLEEIHSAHKRRPHPRVDHMGMPKKLEESEGHVVKGPRGFGRPPHGKGRKRP